MITDVLFSFGANIAEMILGILPEYTPTILTSITTAISTLFGYMNSLNFVLPVTELFVVLKWVIGFELVLFAVRMIIWVGSMLPFVRVNLIDKHSR